MATNPPELKQASIRALRRDVIDDMKVLPVCFREEIEGMQIVPKGGGTFMEVTRARPKLKQWAVPCLLNGSTKSKRSGFACHIT